MSTKKIDIRDILARSESELLKRIGREPTGLLERFICEAQANRILDRLDGLSARDFLNEVVGELGLTVEVTGEDNLPATGRCIFVANHPFGVIDGIVLTRIVCNRYGSFKAIANDAFNLIPNIGGSVATANVYGRTPREAAAQILALYQSDTPITHFPAGEVSRLRSGAVRDGEWHKSFVKYAILTRRDVAPIHIEGRNSWLFHAVHKVRTALGVATNLELSLLPHETFAKRGSVIRATIRKPVGWQDLDACRDHLRAAMMVRNRVYGLPEAGVMA